jgi:CBS domain containing-hemolysin-like protein
VTGLLVAVLLLAANGVFVAAEFALVAVRRTRIDQLAAEGDTRAKSAQRALRDLSFMLSASQLGITMASLGLGFVAEPAIARLLEGPLHQFGIPAAATHSIAFAIALTTVVFFHMVLGEMVPKNIAIAEPERTALWLAAPMRAFTVAFGPLIRGLTALANRGLRLLGVEPRDELVVAHTGEEIAGMLAVSRREGLLEEVGHRLMSGALGFADEPVAAVMVPRGEVAAVGAGSTIEQIERRVIDTGHSRLPVFGRNLDDVIGFVHAKDLLDITGPHRRRPLPPSLVRRMLVVPGDQPLQTVLRSMRRARMHFALVVDGDGRTAGIVTLEDVLEEVVGEIRDEHDDERASED